MFLLPIGSSSWVVVCVLCTVAYGEAVLFVTTCARFGMALGHVAAAYLDRRPLKPSRHSMPEVAQASLLVPRGRTTAMYR